MMEVKSMDKIHDSGITLISYIFFISINFSEIIEIVQGRGHIALSPLTSRHLFPKPMHISL